MVFLRQFISLPIYEPAALFHGSAWLAVIIRSSQQTPARSVRQLYQPATGDPNKELRLRNAEGKSSHPHPHR